MIAKLSATTENRINSIDPIWDSVRREAEVAATKDPILTAFLYSTILNQESLEQAVIQRICERLDHDDIPANLLHQTFHEIYEGSNEWGKTLRDNLQAVYDRDPACTRFLEPLLYFKGFQNLGTGADQNAIAYFGMPVAGFLAGTSQGDPLQDGHIVADTCRHADHHASSMIEEQALADGCRWIDICLEDR